MNIDASKAVSLDIFSDLYILSSKTKDINGKITIKKEINYDIDCDCVIMPDIMTLSSIPLDADLVGIVINQNDPNQTIHVWVPQKEEGTDHTESFTVKRNTKYEAEVLANEGYIEGKLIIKQSTDNMTKKYKDINASVSIYYSKSMDIDCECTVEIERRKSYVYFF